MDTAAQLNEDTGLPEKNATVLPTVGDKPTPIWRVHPLLGTMWKTKNSRFHAADRLRQRGYWKGIALSFLSAYVLVLSVVPKYLEGVGSGAHRDYIGLIALSASIVLLVFSVISIFDEDKLRSSYMHDNAKAITALYHSYKLAIDTAAKNGQSPPSGDTVNEQYQAIMDKCPFNHDSIDWLKTSIDIGKEEEEDTNGMKAKLRLWMFYDIGLWPALSILIPIILSAVFFMTL